MPKPDWLDVSRETFEKLEAFAVEVQRWTSTINLVSKTSIGDLWLRHVLDSAQIYALAPQNPALWVDLGSGGGFPGIVMAIMGAPKMVLVESDQRKATFLREVVRQLQLHVQVLAKRSEDIAPLGAQTLSARALSPLTQLMAHANRHLHSDGVAVFPKGRGAEEEVRLAGETWQFDLQRHPSKTDPEASILLISNIQKR